MNKLRLTLLIAIIFSALVSQAQENRHLDSIYINASSLYQQKKIDKAILEFEKAISLNPNYKDAIFNLAVINYEMGNNAKAISLFQKCVKLGDRASADLLKQQLGQTILYSDTMHLDDLDVLPKVMVQSKQEDVFVNNKWNPLIARQLVDGFKNSKILKKELKNEKKIFLSIYFGKNGTLGAKLLGFDENPLAQEEITSIMQNIAIIPGKYQNKELVAWGITLPVQL